MLAVLLVGVGGAFLGWLTRKRPRPPSVPLPRADTVIEKAKVDVAVADARADDAKKAADSTKEEIILLRKRREEAAKEVPVDDDELAARDNARVDARKR